MMAEGVDVRQRPPRQTLVLNPLHQTNRVNLVHGCHADGSFRLEERRQRRPIRDVESNERLARE